MIGLIVILFGLLVTALIVAPFVLLSGWVVMLCCGALASIFAAPALAIGFWPACLVALILGILFD